MAFGLMIFRFNNKDQLCSLLKLQGLKMSNSKNVIKGLSCQSWIDEGFVWLFFKIWLWGTECVNFQIAGTIFDIPSNFHNKDHSCKSSNSGHLYWLFKLNLIASFDFWIPALTFLLVLLSCSFLPDFCLFFVILRDIRSCTFTIIKTHILWRFRLVFGLFSPILAQKRWVNKHSPEHDFFWVKINLKEDIRFLQT